MPYNKEHAVAYCNQIGADPQALVSGYLLGATGYLEHVTKERWKWYMNAPLEPVRIIPGGKKG